MTSDVSLLINTDLTNHSLLSIDKSYESSHLNGRNQLIVKLDRALYGWTSIASARLWYLDISTFLLVLLSLGFIKSEDDE